MGLFDNIFGKKKKTTPAFTSRLEELRASFPFPVDAVHGSKLEAEILLRRQQPVTGETAVIVGDFRNAGRLVEIWENPFDPMSELARAEALDLRAWFDKRRQDEAKYCEADEQAKVHEAGTAPMNRLTAGYDFKKNPHPEVFIATVPTSDDTALPAHLRFGGWNACPEPYVHVALARYWKERHGAEIVTISADIIEFVVAHPPANDQQAAELAAEQYLYCNDIVDQGVGSIATLARALRHSTRWFFWWD